MGHDTGLNHNYFRENFNDLAKEYVRAIPFLQLEATARPEDIDRAIQKKEVEIYNKLENKFTDVIQYQREQMEKMAKEIEEPKKQNNNSVLTVQH